MTHEDYCEIELKKLYYLRDKYHSVKAQRRIARLIKFFEEYKNE